MFDATVTRNQITVLLSTMGFQVTLLKSNGSKTKSYAVWGKDVTGDLDVSTSQTVGQQKTLYMSGLLKKVPEVGDSIVVAKENWGIDSVEAYKPAKTVIAYKVTASN